MDVYENTIIYIVCPPSIATGGTLLLHQLGHLLLQRDIRTYMVYAPFCENPVPEPYRKYHIPYIEQAEDRAENIVVLPETAVGFYYQAARTILWWMSVDNWASAIVNALKVCQENSFQSNMPWLFYFQPYVEIMHWAQSEYAYRFLRQNSVPPDKICRVGDYLDTVFLQRSQQIDFSAKQNWVAFNPQKGAEFTMKLIKAASDIHWMIIRNMSATEVEELLAASKIYIDFGHHPGKDRIPREAVVSGCCLLTSKRGSAGNEVDIPIADEYKFADDETNMSRILQKIRDILNDYPKYIQDFGEYRRKILQEKGDFIRAVNEALPYGSSVRPVCKAALLSLDESTRVLWRMVNEMEELEAIYIVDDKSSGEVLHDVTYGELTVISREDAAFLYEEGRINCFIGKKGHVPVELQQQLLCNKEDWWMV